MSAMDEPSPTHRPRSTRLAIVVVALVVAAIAGGFFAVGGWPKSHQSRALIGIITPPPPSPSPTPPKLSGHMPAGQALILYRRLGKSERPSELLGATWSGALYTGYDTPTTIGAAFQSPDGSKLLFGSRVYEVTTANDLGGLSISDGVPWTALWGDDSRHICWMSGSNVNSPADVSIQGVGMPAVHLASLPGAQWQGSGGQLVSFPSILACSPLAGVVVVAQVGGGGENTDVWVLNAGTGTVEYHQAFPPAAGASGTRVVASQDGEYLAEIDSAGASSIIRRWSDGSVLAQLAGLEVHAFSWDDSRVLVTDRQPGLAIINVSFQSPSVIDLRTGQAIWQAPPGSRWFDPELVVQPGGAGLALGLNVCNPDCQVNLWLIGADGKGRELDHNVQMLP
ncbi:MAG: hypothetical protein ACHQ0J_09365 [Candidatus Dormibacterales bacterium]